MPHLELNQVHCCDAMEGLSQLPDESAHCCITSPPYWRLRDYGLGDKGIGLEKTPEEYVEKVVAVFREVRRVLRKDGTLWLNMGDCYAGSGKGPSKSLNRECDHLEDKSGGIVPAGLKPKDLVGMPWRVAFALQADGWWLRSDIIWAKPNPMPESVRDRPTKAHEYLFLLSKAGTATYWTHRDLAGVREKPKADYRWQDNLLEVELDSGPEGWRTEMIDNPALKKRPELADDEQTPKRIRRYRRFNLWRGHDYFYDQDAVREEGQGTPWHGIGGYREGNIDNAFAPEEYSHDRPTTGRNKCDVWLIATQPFPEAHFATFPEKLVEPCILAGTSEKGACAECGAPWGRVIEKGLTAHDGKTDCNYEEGMTANRLALLRQAARQRGEEYINRQRTIGWRPTCNCETETVPCIVLDPFIGSGTVGVVAKKLCCDFVGFELNPKYGEMANRRIGRVVGQRTLEMAMSNGRGT